jgi:hypothetical protein
MNHRTITVVLPAPAPDVFAYLSSVENLPDWATDFAQELKVVDGRHKVVNGLGELFFRITADERTGVIDMYAGPTEDQMAIFPARVVALPGDRSLFTFTMFQAPGAPYDLFDGQYWSLLGEMDNIRHRFGAAA